MRVPTLLLLLGTLGLSEATARETGSFRAGVARREITPPAGLPMWGYAARHDATAVGKLDPLIATAVVIEAGTERMAIVATDLGRGPTPAMLEQIRKRVASEANIRLVLICGSHTHHGPVIELVDQPGRGQGRFAPALAYSETLPRLLGDCIIEASKNLRSARIGASSTEVAFNRNRQAKKRPKVTDRSLTLIRLDDEAGKPIAVLVNYAAHPTMTDSKSLMYSADFPGTLRTTVERELNAPCLFLQGASGDLSASAPPNTAPGPIGFGDRLGREAVEAARRTSTTAPKSPSIKSETSITRFKPRIDLQNPLVQAIYARAFFPELIACAADEHGRGVDAQVSTVLLNGEIAIVGASGEFFCEHANRLRSRLDTKTLLFLGYCNGHHFYFPTIEAASEGGYGTEPGICLAELGSGERLMDQALLSFYRLMGRIPTESK